MYINNDNYFISVEKLNVATIVNANVRAFCGIDNYLDCLYIARPEAKSDDTSKWQNYFNGLGQNFDAEELLEQLEASALDDIQNGKIRDGLDQKLIVISSLNLLSTDKVKFAYQIIGILSSLVYLTKKLPKQVSKFFPRLSTLLKQAYAQYKDTLFSSEPSILEEEKDHIKALKEAKILDLILVKKIIDINSIQIIKDNIKDLS